MRFVASVIGFELHMLRLIPIFLFCFSALAAPRLPADVSKFIERREACDHFRGEEAYDEARAKELAVALEKNCKGTDAQLAGLRKKYAKDKKIMRRLKGYENRVE